MTENETTTRAALRVAIKDAAAANAVARRASEAVMAASTMLSEAERDLAAARGALEQARAPQRPLAERLAEAGSDDGASNWSMSTTRLRRVLRSPSTIFARLVCSCSTQRTESSSHGPNSSGFSRQRHLRRPRLIGPTPGGRRQSTRLCAHNAPG